MGRRADGSRKGASGHVAKLDRVRQWHDGTVPEPRATDDFHDDDAALALADSELLVPRASASTLLFSAAAMERRIRSLPDGGCSDRARLISISGTLRGELQLMEGLLHTLARPPVKEAHRCKE